MSIQPIIVAYPEKIASRAHAGVISPATSRDDYKAGNDSFAVGDWSTWRHNQPVDAITQMGYIHFRVGAIVEVHGLDKRLHCRGQITGIRMIVPDKISDDDIALLSAENRASWIEQTGGFTQRRGLWMIELDILPGDIEGEAVGQITIEIHKPKSSGDSPPKH